MSHMAHIRKNVFRITQSEMAGIAGCRQATVSRWETGELEPDREEMSRIRAEAASRGLQWDDRWFFDTAGPRPEEAAA